MELNISHLSATLEVPILMLSFFAAIEIIPFLVEYT